MFCNVYIQISHFIRTFNEVNLITSKESPHICLYMDIYIYIYIYIYISL